MENQANERDLIKNNKKDVNDVNDVVLVSLSLTLNRFRTLFGRFPC